MFYPGQTYIFGVMAWIWQKNAKNSPKIVTQIFEGSNKWVKFQSYVIDRKSLMVSGNVVSYIDYL